MASQEQRRELTAVVLDAIRYRRWNGGNENPALGEAILRVDELLLPWAQRELADGGDELSPDAENLVADAGVKAIIHFHTFSGTTGGEFYEWIKAIVAQLIAGMKRLHEALANGGLRRVRSLEREHEAAQLAELLISPEDSPEEAATIRENGQRLRKALRGLNLVEHRIVKLRLRGRSYREIAATFGHAVSWAHEIWESAAHHLRLALVSRRRTRQAFAA
jgi:RNA polymerase sigma factor (sigma-70 family)